LHPLSTPPLFPYTTLFRSIIFDRMYAMDPKFCLENLLYLDKWLSLEIVFAEKNYPMKIRSQLLVQCTDIDVSKLTKIQLHSLTRHLHLLSWSMLKDNHDYSKVEEFKRVLVNSALSFIDKAVCYRVLQAVRGIQNSASAVALRMSKRRCSKLCVRLTNSIS